MQLSELVEAIGPLEVRGDTGVDITAVTYAADQAVPGALHVCVPGFRADGHDFAEIAVERGAVALAVERFLPLDVPQLLVSSSRSALAVAADAFFGRPSAQLDVVGITGTNGKTTTAFLMYAILEAAGRRPGLLGTVEQRIGGGVEKVSHTTPERLELQATFRRMVDVGDRSCSMEVSSHALELHRVDGVSFACAAFTNLTQDHLDFHPTMEDYYLAKRRLFEGPWPAVVNADDEYGRRLAGELDSAITFAVEREADYRARAVRFDLTGARFTCEAPEGAIAM